MTKDVSKRFEETFEDQSVISGVRCIVQANLKNGIIYAYVNASTENYCHKVDFKQGKSAGKT
jgi:hypothetical protein